MSGVRFDHCQPLFRLCGYGRYYWQLTYQLPGMPDETFLSFAINGLRRRTELRLEAEAKAAFAEMQKPLSACRVEMKHRGIPNQARLEYKDVVTGTWMIIRGCLKQGFASLRGGKDRFLQICKKMEARGERCEEEKRTAPQSRPYRLV